MKKKMKGKKLIAGISTITLLVSTLFCLAGCQNEEPGYKRQHIYFEIFDMNGNFIPPHEGSNDYFTGIYTSVTYYYTGEPIKFTVDMIIKETGERLKNYGDILIDFNKQSDDKLRYIHIGGGWQKDDLNWPTEVGSYCISINIADEYIYINGKRYAKYEHFDKQLFLKIQEK